MIKSNGLLQRDDPNADIVKELKPKKGEIVIEKRRISAFHGTDLNTILKSNDVKEITMFGVSTGGAVLSTSVDAADLDYKVTILKKCCSDRNKELHDTLVNKVLSIRSNVI
jgi:nicotinamidase-related amidase